MEPIPTLSESLQIEESLPIDPFHPSETSEEPESAHMRKNFTSLSDFLLAKHVTYPLPGINYHTIAVAPMIDVTDTHFRNLMRLLTRYSVLYTEMIHEQAIHNNIHRRDDFLVFDPVQHPVVLQLGGNDPYNLAKAAKLCESYGYDEINLNVGCPSDRVQSGKFGACLMKEPDQVAEIMRLMIKSCSVPCTVKCRLGVDDFDSYEFARDFIHVVSTKGGVDHFVVHARKAFLKGLNPSENRNIPPLKYDFVLRLKQDFPHLNFSINGGFRDYAKIAAILAPENGLKGCMVGRAAQENPWFFSDVDRSFYGKPNPGFSRREILQVWGKYGKHALERNPGVSIPTLNKPILRLFDGEKHSSKYRHFLSDKHNFHKYGDYEKFISVTIKGFESLNKTCLDQRPIGSEEADFTIADALLCSVTGTAEKAPVAEQGEQLDAKQEEQQQH